MLADSVRVRTRSDREHDRAGSGSPTAPAPSPSARPRACRAAPRSILHLKDDAKELAEELAASRRSSAAIRASSRTRSGSAARSSTIRSRSGSSRRARSRDEQYTQFYQHLTHHAGETPLWHLHLAADSPIQFRAILYCPPTNFERLGFGRDEHGLSLCAKRVLVQSRLPRAAARIPPLPPRAGRLGGPAAERLPRDAPGQHRLPQDPQHAGQGRLRPARDAGERGRRTPSATFYRAVRRRS